MNAIKITCLSLSRGSWPCVSSLLLYHREWLGVMGPTILTGIDLFQKWINSEFQGLREKFRLSLLKRWYLIFLVQRWGEKSGKWEKQDKNSIWIKSGGEFLFFPIFYYQMIILQWKLVFKIVRVGTRIWIVNLRDD